MISLPKIPRAVVEVLICFGVVALAAFCAGEQHAEHSVSSKQIAALQAKRDTATDTIHVVERRIVVDTQHVRVVDSAARHAAARFDSAAAELRAVADTSTTRAVPVSLALPPLEYCTAAIAAKDTVIAAQAKVITDLTADRDAWKSYAIAGDSIIALTPKPPCLGFKSGLVAGIAIVAALVHFVW